MSIHLVLRLNQNLESLLKHNPAFQELFWAEIESCFVCLHLREPHLEPGSACSFQFRRTLFKFKHKLQRNHYVTEE